MVDQHRGTAGVAAEVDEPLLVVVQVNPALRPRDVAQFLPQRRVAGGTVGSCGDNDADLVGRDPSSLELLEEVRQDPSRRSRPCAVVDDDHRSAPATRQLPNGKLSTRSSQGLKDIVVVQRAGSPGPMGDHVPVVWEVDVDRLIAVPGVDR